MTHNGSLTIKNNGLVMVNGNLYANNTVDIQDNAKLEIHGDAYFSKNIDKKIMPKFVLLVQVI